MFVFERLTDHEAMAEWPGIASARLLRVGNKGQPRNGVGAIREICARGFALHEEIVRYEPPHCYAYTVIKGLPITHLGTVTLTASESDDLTTLCWRVSMSSRIPFFAPILGRMLRKGLPNALAFFQRETEKASNGVSQKL
jgi:uncharacterized protein YndB with AHSA1/START domain